MSADAVVLMVVSMLILWGGLILAVLRLSRNGGTPPVDGAQRDL